MSQNEKAAPLYSIWENIKTGNKLTIVGYCELPELKTLGIILGRSNKKPVCLSVDAFVKSFKRIDNEKNL